MSNALSSLLPCLTLFAWAGLLIHFYVSGRLSAFLIPVFRPGVLVAGIVLLVLAIAALIAPDHSTCCDDDADCGHPLGRRTSGRLLAFAVLLLPIAAAAALSTDGFSRTTMENRGILVDAAGLGRESSGPSGRAYEPPLPTADGSGAPLPADEDFIDPSEYLPRTPEGYVKAEVIDFLYAASEPELRQDFEGETVAIVGQYMPENRNGSGTGFRFKLVRMFMSCCAADARPVGVVVQSETRPPFPEMAWVRVVGRAEFPVVDGKSTAIVKARSVEESPPPEETMLY